MDFWIPDENFFTKNSRFAFTPHPCGDFFLTFQAFYKTLIIFVLHRSGLKFFFDTVPEFKTRIQG